jgi:hypothetical protein
VKRRIEFNELDRFLFELEKKSFSDDPAHRALLTIIADMKKTILDDKGSEELLVVYRQLKDKYNCTTREKEYTALIRDFTNRRYS